MSIVLKLCVLLSVIYSLQSQAPQKQHLNIGLVRHQKDQASENLLREAVDYLNEELAENHLAVELRTQTLADSDGSEQTLKDNSAIFREGIVTLIDLADRQQARVLSEWCGKHGVPHFGAYWHQQTPRGASVMDLEVISGTSLYRERVYNYLSTQYDWDRLFVVSSTNHNLLGLQQRVTTDRFADWQHDHASLQRTVMSSLHRLEPFDPVLVDMPYWQIPDFMAMVSSHNLTRPSNVFIFTDWDSSLEGSWTSHTWGAASMRILSILDEPIADRMSIRERLGKRFKFLDKNNAGIHLMHRHAFLLDSMSLLLVGFRHVANSTIIRGLSISNSQEVQSRMGAALFQKMMTVSHGPDDDSSSQFPSVDHLRLSVLERVNHRFEKTALETKPRTFKKRVIRSTSDKEQSGRPLRVTTILDNPFVLYKGPRSSNYESNIDYWDGFCMELLKEIGKDLGLSFSIHVVADKKYGALVNYPDGRTAWNGMIGELLTNKADLIMSSLTISYERERVIDFTTPFMNYGLGAIAFRPAKTSSFSYIWMFIILLYIVLGLLTCFISHRLPFERIESTSSDDKSKTASRSGWFRLAPIPRKGGCPHAVSMRTISIVWWILSAIVLIAYIIYMVAFLKGIKVYTPIASVDDLVKQTEVQYGTVRGGSTEAFFKNSARDLYQQIYRNMVDNPGSSVSNNWEGVERVLRSKGNYVFIMESKTAEYYAIRYCSLFLLPNLNEFRGYGIGLPAGSPLRENMTRSINKLQMNQKLQALQYKWWNTMNEAASCSATPQNMNEHWIFGIGLLIMALVALVELYVLFRQKKYNLNVQFHKFLFSHLHSVLQSDKDSKAASCSKVMTHDTVTFKYTTGDPETLMCSVTANAGQLTEEKDK